MDMNAALWSSASVEKWRMASRISGTNPRRTTSDWFAGQLKVRDRITWLGNRTADECSLCGALDEPKHRRLAQTYHAAVFLCVGVGPVLRHNLSRVLQRLAPRRQLDVLILSLCRVSMVDHNDINQ
jgi:hypothetical protein